MNFHEQFVGESFGRINKAEADLTLLTLAEYLTQVGKRRVLEESIDVGIISPYRAQVQYLKRLLKKYEFFKPYRRLISVNTVDGFQGQERDVILISLVRSNDEGQIGFLKDLRRMNVAMTRARMKLIILGDKSTMTKHPSTRSCGNTWRAYFTSFNLNEFSTTLTLEQAMRALAHIGVIWKSMPKRCKTPAARGMQTML